MTGISERLQKVYDALGIKRTANSRPSRKCALVGAGFCAKNGCYVDGVLDNQAVAGGINDDRLTEATSKMVTDAMAHGCNILEK